MAWACISSFRLGKKTNAARKAASFTVGGVCGVQSCKRSLAYKTIQNLDLGGFIFKILYIFIITRTRQISECSQRNWKLYINKIEKGENCASFSWWWWAFDMKQIQTPEKELKQTCNIAIIHLLTGTLRNSSQAELINVSMHCLLSILLP